MGNLQILTIVHIVDVTWCFGLSLSETWWLIWLSIKIEAQGSCWSDPFCMVEIESLSRQIMELPTSTKYYEIMWLLWRHQMTFFLTSVCSLCGNVWGTRFLSVIIFCQTRNIHEPNYISVAATMSSRILCLERLVICLSRSTLSRSFMTREQLTFPASPTHGTMGLSCNWGSDDQSYRKFVL